MGSLGVGLSWSRKECEPAQGEVVLKLRPVGTYRGAPGAGWVPDWAARWWVSGQGPPSNVPGC